MDPRGTNLGLGEFQQVIQVMFGTNVWSNGLGQEADVQELQESKLRPGAIQKTSKNEHCDSSDVGIIFLPYMTAWSLIVAFCRVTLDRVQSIVEPRVQ